jgi:hypothetical protein
MSILIWEQIGKPEFPSAYAALLRGDFDRAKLEIRYADPYQSGEFKART